MLHLTRRCSGVTNTSSSLIRSSSSQLHRLLTRNSSFAALPAPFSFPRCITSSTASSSTLASPPRSTHIACVSCRSTALLQNAARRFSSAAPSTPSTPPTSATSNADASESPQVDTTSLTTATLESTQSVVVAALSTEHRQQNENSKQQQLNVESWFQRLLARAYRFAHDSFSFSLEVVWLTAKFLAALWLIRMNLVDIVECQGQSMLPTFESRGDYMIVARSNLLIRIGEYLSPTLKQTARTPGSNDHQDEASMSAFAPAAASSSSSADRPRPKSNVQRFFNLITPSELAYNRGDVVVALSPLNPHMHVCKRIIGMPGDRIDGRLIQSGQVWLQGDNLNNSNDSRAYGPVPMALIQGRVIGKDIGLQFPFFQSVRSTLEYANPPPPAHSLDYDSIMTLFDSLKSQALGSERNTVVEEKQLIEHLPTLSHNETSIEPLAASTADHPSSVSSSSTVESSTATELSPSAANLKRQFDHDSERKP